MDQPRPDRWTAVINPAAGRGRGMARLPAIADALAAADLDVTVHVSADVTDLRAIVQGALDAGRGVVACGGDGTVSVAAGLVAEADGVLGVLPAGSGNDLARHLGLPRGDLAAAVAVLERGVVTCVDLGRAETADGAAAWFTTVANTGFDAEANRWANTLDWLTGAPLYVLAVLRTLTAYRPRPVRIRVDGAVTDVDAWLVAVGNTRSYASGMVITPAASVHDGLLDVCVVGPVSRAGFLRTFPTVFRGTHVQHPLVSTLRGTEVAIEALDTTPPAPELWASGERVGTLPARLRPAPGALRVVVPPGERPGGTDRALSAP
jgi:diacylglycerol kinase (ATP)